MSRSGINRGLQKKAWSFFPQNNELSAGLAEALQIPLPLAQVLVNRGIKTAAAGESFLKPEPEQLCSPFAMKDMEAAVKIIWQAVQEGRRIAVYGDYDVDGIGATALLFILLRRLGANVVYHLPDRLGEGYGLHEHTIARLAKEKIFLLVTVDCGISDKEAVAYARDQGMEVVITDHHLPPANLPPADAIVNPRQPKCSYPFKDLCGAGVAFKLGQALLLQQDQMNKANMRTADDAWQGMEDYLDLVALATVADMVPLLGENRVLVTHGLHRMNTDLRPGLAALCEMAAAGEKITAETISFIIAPRLNAAGRLGDASRALELLLAGNMEEALPLAGQLHEENKHRRQVETDILAEASKMAEEMSENETDFILLAAPDWAPGVIGIVASRLLEQYQRPVMLISLAEGQGKGSGRSGEDFNLNAALEECAPLLLAYGGHHCAAGLTVQEEHIPRLRQELNRLARQWRGVGEPAPSFFVDAPLKPQQITEELMWQLERLEPFGFGNPRPLFYGEKWFLEQKREVGREKRHLQLGLSRDGSFFKAIFFNGKNKLPGLQPCMELDVFFNLSFNVWRGQNNLQLHLYDGLIIKEYVQGKISLLDYRGSERKLDYLRALGGEAEGCLIFVNTLSRLQSLERQLGWNKGFYFTHQGNLKPEQVGEVLPSRLVLYDLPLQQEKLKELLQHLSGLNKLTVHLLYGTADWQDNLRLLTATIPSFSALEQIYYALQEMAATGQYVTYNEVLSKLKQSLPFSPTSFLLDKCLLIMQETACLELDKGRIKLVGGFDDDYCALLETVAAADQYDWARRKWLDAFRWQKFLLNAKGEEILNFCFEGVQDSKI